MPAQNINVPNEDGFMVAWIGLIVYVSSIFLMFFMYGWFAAFMVAVAGFAALIVAIGVTVHMEQRKADTTA